MTNPVTEQALEDARWAVKWTDCAASGEAELYRIRGYRMARALLALAAENERLRASLGNGNQPCIYCNLPKEDWAKCRAGFPGCDRADDVMLCPNVGASLDADELNATLRERVAELEGALRFYRNSWTFKTGKQPGLTWQPKEELLDDCGNKAKAALGGQPLRSGK